MTGDQQQGLDRELLERLAAGEPASAELARRLALSAEARRDLAEIDPTAIFGVLGALPLEAPPPARREPPARRREAHPLLRRGILAAAAALVAALCLGLLATGGAPESMSAEDVRGAGQDPSASGFYQVVRRVHSPTARVVVVVPSTAKGPTVTMIIDEENEL